MKSKFTTNILARLTPMDVGQSSEGGGAREDMTMSFRNIDVVIRYKIENNF